MPPPNLLFLYTDEQRADTFAAAGNAHISMPNLNRLAAQSTVFQRAYVTQPVCTPSRSTLLTGLYPHTSGCTENNIPLDLSTPCLPEFLPQGVYATGHYGKWHLGDELFAQHGFEEWVSIEDMYNRFFREGRDRSRRSDYFHWLLGHGLQPEGGGVFGRDEAARLPEEYSKPAFLAERAGEFIRRHRGHPWCLYVNFLEPHMPFFGPRDGQYDPAEVPLPKNFDSPPTEAQPLKTRVFREAYRQWGHSGMELKTEADWRRMIANYWGLCSLVDTHVGRILETLEDCGLSDRTIVVFTSDHGDMMGSHQMLAKCTMFEEAIRVPLMVRLPGQSSGRSISRPVSQVDLVPTLLERMGVEPPDTLEGQPLPELAAASTEPNDEVFVEWNGPNSGVVGEDGQTVRMPDALAGTISPQEVLEAVGDPVRTVLSRDGWKCSLSARGEHEMYDLNSDPLETRNLAAESACRARLRSARDNILRWQERTDDTVILPEV